MGHLGELLAELDEDKLRRGKQFERVTQWFLTNAPMYRNQVCRVWLWDEWPGRWSADAGIDLVVEDREGRRWAIQSKAYDPKYTVTKADVDTFLSESSRAQFSYRLLVATTNRVGHTARRTIAAQEKQAGLLLLADLEAADVDWPASPGALLPVVPKAKRPRSHQADAIEAVVERFVGCDRGQLIMACGTGKTLTALFVAERLRAQRTLVLVPSLSLLAQTLREWTANASGRFDYLPVCSDDTVADPDAALSSTSDLGFPVTTDAQDIARFLRRRSGRLVVLSTYQSSPRIAAAYRYGRVPKFDLAIGDEAHRCAGRASSDFATILDDAEIPAKRRLFMTATPRYFTGRVVREAKDADFEVASMDNPEVFGPVFHRLSFGAAIERNLLSDYQVAVIGVDDATYREWAQRGRFVTIDGTEVTDARRLAGQIGLAKAMRRYCLRRTISFHSRVTGARDFARSLTDVVRWMPADQRPAGALWAQHVSGEMATADRTIRLERLRHLDDDTAGLLANARCLAEGVDVPTLDAVAFVDPRRSEVDIIQAVGRAIRKAENKKIGTIVIPVFIATGEDPQAALDDSAFKPVWDVIRALRAHDEQLAEQLDAIRRTLPSGRATVELPQKLHLDLPARIGPEFAAAFDVRLVERTTAPWESRFGVLQMFTEREGHSRVPQGHVEGALSLGAWVAAQRRSHTQGQLAPGRVRCLEALPGWTWLPRYESWENAFHALEGFATREGDCRVPQNHVEGAVSLGRWVSRQRADQVRGELEPQRRKRLEALPGWNWDMVSDDWERGFRVLQSFTEQQGHSRAPAKHVDDGVGQWVRSQRLRHKRGQLEPERADRLEALPGWAWDANSAAWESGFDQLQAFAAREGHSHVPRDHVEGGVKLGQWCGLQRDLHKRGKLKSERVARLQALTGWTWTPLVDVWKTAFRVLEAFAAREGHSRVPAAHVEGTVTLGTWVGIQRSVHKRGKLDPARAERLEALPGWSWDAISDKWENAFLALEAFADRQGHCRVSRNHVEGTVKLGQWVVTQRSTYLRGRLGSERIARLEALPAWTWLPRQDRWESGFQALEAFATREGHCRVPTVHVEGTTNLGKWVEHQRRFRKRRELAPERANRLEALPSWTWSPRTPRPPST